MSSAMSFKFNKADSFEASPKEDLEPPFVFTNNSHDNLRQRLQRASAYVTSGGSDFHPCKNRLISSSVNYGRRLSVTNLLERAESQRDNFANLFPLIDKEKYQKNAAMAFNDLEEVESGKNIFNKKDNAAEDLVDEAEEKVLIKKIENGQCMPLNNTKDDLVKIRNDLMNLDLRQVSKRRESIPVVILHDSVPPPVDYRRGLADVWCGVNIEYMVLSNKLRISVERFGTLLGEYGTNKRVFLFAKVCLMPGNLQRQKVDVISGMEARLMKPSVFFRGMSGPHLIQMEIGITLYLKQGFLRKPKLIHEWSIPMAEVDLIEAQTAWKRIDGHL